MRKTTLLMAALFAGLATAAQAAEDCKLALAASMDIDPAFPHRIAISPVINDTPVKMLIDTGAVMTVVGQDVVDKLRLPRMRLSRKSLFQSFDGTVIEYDTIIPTLQTGNLHARDVQALINPKNFEDGIAGVIGPDLLMHYEVELDFTNNKLNLFSQDHCPGHLVYWTHDPVATIPISIDKAGHIRLEVTLDGKTLEGALDTGAPGASMKMATARREFDLTPDTPGMERESNGEPARYLYTFKSLGLGGIAIANTQVRISDVAADPDEAKLFLVGLRILKKMHVMISYKERMLYATSVNAH